MLVWLSGYVNFVSLQVLENAYHVGICLLGVGVGGLQRGVKYTMATDQCPWCCSDVSIGGFGSTDYVYVYRYICV